MLFLAGEEKFTCKFTAPKSKLQLSEQVSHFPPQRSQKGTQRSRKGPQVSQWGRGVVEKRDTPPGGPPGGQKGRKKGQ